MPIITISRQLGSQGSDIAKLLNKEFNCSYLDKELLEKAFNEYGIPRESVERFDEKKPGFWDLFKTDKARYLHYMKGAMLEFARKGNGIILGRGGQVLLAGISGVLHVRIFAPLNVRLERIMKQYECDERHAEKIIQGSDSERAGFHRFFFGVNWEDINLYELAINTGSLSSATTIQVIRSIVESEEYKAAEAETSLKLNDLCLEHEIKTAIIYKENLSIQFLEVQSEQGNVFLRGIVDNSEDLERVEIASGKIPGVKSVKNEIYYNPISTAYGLHY